MMFGGQIDEFDYHYFGWNYEFLNSYLLINKSIVSDRL